MPIDTSNIDIKAVIDQLCCIAWLKPTRTRGEIVYKGGPCPFCHLGTDRFAVFPEAERPHFYCGIHGNGCGAHGDVIGFVRQLKGYPSAGPAIRDLKEMGFPVGAGSVGTYRPSMRAEHDKPCQKWQDLGYSLIQSAQKYLWSDRGKEPLAYLHGRGLTDATILQFRLGYWPAWTEYKLADWGLAENGRDAGDGTFWIRPGILIPCIEKNVLWSINQRITAYTVREQEQAAQGTQLPRYKKIRGSVNSLFNVDAIQPDEPLFVTEGEIDAMTISQATSYRAVATGSTKGAQLSQWIASLSMASRLLITFDNDGGKGEAAATYWTETIFPEKASYWQPWAKDVNEMLQQGQDLALWATQGVDLTAYQPPIEAILESKPSTISLPPTEAILESKPAIPLPPLEASPQEQPGSERSEEAGHTKEKYSDPHDDPVVQEAMRLFDAQIVEIVYRPEKMTMPVPPPYQPPPRPDFWTALREKQTRFDSTKPVNWREYGFQLDAQGRWYMPRKQQ